MFNKSSGPSCSNIVDFVASSISLIDNTGHYNDINDIFLHQDEVITANKIGKSYEYPSESINDENVSNNTADYPTGIYVTMHYDAVLNIRDTGVELLD